MDFLMSLDEVAMKAVLSIYRNDLAQAKESTEDDAADIVTAIETHLSEIEECLRLEEDRRMAQSITNANLNDHKVIDAILRMEKQDRDNQEVARRLAGVAAGSNLNVNPINDQRPPSYNEATSQDKPTLSKLAGLWVSEDAGKALHPDRSQTGVDMGITTQLNCVACGDEKSYFEVIDAPCGHIYCKECIRELFEKSCHDETMFPPRCCRQQIQPSHAAIFLTRELIEQFEEKLIEFSCDDRTYCTNRECLKFIPPGTIANGIGHCQKCNTNTCTFCKNEAHRETDCPNDVNLQAVIDLAKTEGWQRCGRCRMMVELGIGCYHMTCRCGYEFCYLCAAHWKTCRCEQWDERRLVDRAQEVAGREGRDVRVVREEIVARHNCAHQHWQRVGGRGNCENCDERLPHFLYRCQQCRIMVCRTCQLNRLR